MKLRKLQINGFGNIENREIELGDKINLIYGKNEAGKSTIVNFIKCIFYGANRNKAGNEFSEYELFKPWKNAEFNGKIEYEMDGNKYTVFRDFNRNNCKIYDADGTDITADFSKDKTRGSEVGFQHLGIDEETFVNTMLVGQNQSIVDMSSQKSIIQKLTNILQSGQESISFEKIESKLQKKMIDEVGTERTHNKPINVVKREISEKEQTISRLLYNRNRKETLEERKIELEEQQKRVEQNIEQINKVMEVRQKYASLLEEKERTYELTTKLKEKERQEKIEIGKKQFRNAAVFLLLTTIIVCAVLIYFHFYMWSIIEIFIAMIGVIVLKATNQNKIPPIEDTDFNVTKEELNKKEAKELEKMLQKGIKSTYIERKTLELKNLLDGLEKNKSDLILECHKIKIEEESLKENIERLSDLEEQLIELNAKKEYLYIKAKVISLTIQKLEDAFEELKSEVIPDIQRSIRKQIEITTNGNYQNAIYNNEEGIVVENSLGEYVPISKLSLGTIDQMYLGFRLGIGEKIKNIPLIMDESFAYYDNERLENLMRTIKNTNRQIILLTCSDREKRILEKLHVDYHYTEL